MTVTVTGCSDCPLATDDAGRCNVVDEVPTEAFGDEPSDVFEHTHGKAGSPGWCPLRRGAVMVRRE